MPDFLLELLSEEIPARMQAGAEADLARLFVAEIAKSGLAAAAIDTYSTPRRLALVARNLPAETTAIAEEVKGPRADAPPQAIEGFLRKTGLARDALTERDGVLFAVIDRPGRASEEVLAEAIPAIIRAFPWPKSMRWGVASTSTSSLSWVRPLQGIVALLDGRIVPCEVAGVHSGASTLGHRFHHPGAITIGGVQDYATKLRACHVIVDPAERRQIIAEGARTAASAAGLVLVEDEALVAENAGLTEWPVALLGHFDPAFLGLPREVIQLTMRANQKYFACMNAKGALAPAFICTANIEAKNNGKGVVAGNERVLSARLADAKFFWEQDLKVPLEEQAKKLNQIVFHEKLGTVADKVERVARLARKLAEEGIIKGADADATESAARLCKADLVTGMVGEFPELQGIIGGYLARAQGQPDAVADAISDHYGLVTQNAVATCVSLADKLDTVLSFFSIGEKPTGSRDPFALRRAGLGAMFLILSKNLRLDLTAIAPRDVVDFLIERWKFQNRESGGRPDLVDAVVSVASDGNLGRLASRMQALQAFVETPEGADLLAGYKRAANILKKEGWGQASSGPGKKGRTSLTYSPEKEEAALIVALDAAEPVAEAAIAAEDFEGAMAALASLRAPVDAFFDKVTVNDPDPAKREARLVLLARMRDAVHRVADFSKIEG